jgi:hypothetical protein
MKEFFRFMANNRGRLLRIILGGILVIWGLLLYAQVNWPLTIIGFIPLFAGLFDFCVFAPVFGYPINGNKLRKRVRSEH